MQLAPFNFDEKTLTLTYVDRFSNGRVLAYRISEAPGGVRVRTEKLSKAEKAEASERIAWMLGLDMDFTAFYKAARKEPKLAHVKKTARGRVLRSPTLFEDVVKTIEEKHLNRYCSRNSRLKKQRKQLQMSHFH